MPSAPSEWLDRSGTGTLRGLVASSFDEASSFAHRATADKTADMSLGTVGENGVGVAGHRGRRLNGGAGIRERSPYGV